MENAIRNKITDKYLLIPVMSDGDVEFLPALSKHLIQKGFRVNFITSNSNLEDAIVKRVGAKQVLRGLPEHSPERPLAELLEKFEIESPRSFVVTEMAYDYSYLKPSSTPYIFSGFEGTNYSTYIEKLHQYLDFLDQIYRSGFRGIPLQHQGGEILRRSLQAVADKYEIPSIWIGFSPINGSSGMHQNESESWGTFESASLQQMSAKEKTRAREFIDQFRSDTSKIQSGSYQRSLTENIKQKLNIIVRHTSELGPFIERWIRGHIFKRVSASYARRKYLNRKESKRLINKSNYIFYPIQYYRESRVLVRAPAFYKQSWLIEYLSRSLPLNHELFVKDHPNQLGAQPKSEIDAIVRHAKALSPSYPVAPILKNASAVVVLNNTVGYEAILSGKPVVTLGKGFYTDLGYTFEVEDINDLSNVLSKAIDQGGPSQEELIEFVHGLFEGSYKGIWGDKSDQNLANLANSIDSFHSDIVQSI